MSVLLKKMFNFAKMRAKPRIIPLPDIHIVFSGHVQFLDSWDIENRLAPFCFLYWNESAGAQLSAGGETVKLMPDQLVLVTPYTLFSARLTAPVTGHHYVHFMAGPPFHRMRRKILTVPITEKDKEAFHTAPSSALCPLRFYRMLFSVMLQLPEEFFSPDHPDAVDSRIVRVLELIRLNPDRNFSNAELAAAAAMSEHHFCHVFTAVTGLPPYQYQIRQRLENTIIMLQDPAVEIEEIALANGFSDRYHFSKMFKRHYGIPPVAMRRRMTQDVSKRNPSK